MGNLFWPYVSTVILTESGFSIASLTLWSCVLFMSIATGSLIGALGAAGTFFLFSGITFLGGFVLLFTIKEAKGASAEELKNLFIPKDK